jgi:hypothetical protein
VRRLDQPPGSCQVVSNLPPVNPVSVGGEVYYSHDPGGEVVDTVSGDAPANAARIAERYLPYIEAKLSE